MKTLMYEFSEGTDLRFIKKAMKRVLEEYGVDPKIKTFEDSDHLRISLLDEASYIRAKSLVSERIEGKGLYEDNENLRTLLTDTAVFYMLRFNEDKENENAVKAVDKAMKDVALQLGSCSRKGEKNETRKKNNAHGDLSALQQIVIPAY